MLYYFFVNRKANVLLEPVCLNEEWSFAKRLGLSLEAWLAENSFYQAMVKNNYQKDCFDFFVDNVAKPKKILHCGAHLGEEHERYLERGVSKVVWSECQPDLIPMLNKKFGSENVYDGVVSKEGNRFIDFFVTSNRLSSSTLEILDNDWGIEVIKKVRLRTITLNEMIGRFFRTERSLPDLIVLDLQGGEFNAVLGGKDIFRFQIPCIVEFSTFQLYKDAKVAKEIVDLMGQHNFTMIYSDEKPHGEALFVSKNLLSQYNSHRRKMIRVCASMGGVVRGLFLRLIQKLIYILKSM